MKHFFNLSTKVAFCITALFLIISCKKKENTNESYEVPANNKIPEVITNTLSGVSQTTANAGGKVINQGSANIISKGVCFSTHINPTVADRKTNNTGSSSEFGDQLKALAANTTYYLRAYATNTFGTAYGNEVAFTTPKDLDGTVTDADGNVYHSVKIGTQEWLVENLRTTTYQNGDPIPNLIYDTEWGDTRIGAYCFMLNDKLNSNIYGSLYNWYVIGDNRGIAPSGWHVPSETEWNTLINFLGGYSVAGGKLKEVSTTTWTNPNIGATNESGFSAKGGGVRSVTGAFMHGGTRAFFWTKSDLGGNNAKHTQILASASGIGITYIDKTYGSSIRLLKD